MKQKTLRLTLAAVVAAAASVPLIAQVRKAQTQQPVDTQQPVPADPGAAGATGPQAAAPPATRPALDPSTVILTNGDIKLTAGEFDAVVATLGPQAEAAVAQPAIRKQLADKIVQIKMLANIAKAQKLDDRPDVKRQIAIQTDQVLAQALNNDEQADRTYFDTHKQNFDEVKARHILIRTPDSPVPAEAGKPGLSDAQAKAKAEQIKAQLDKGGDFAKIAKAESDDKGSGAMGGDLGSFAPYRMDPAFSEAALALKKNQISGPVKSQFGYHIIQLLDDKPRSYEEAKSEVGQARMTALVRDLTEKSKPEYDPAFFGSATPKSNGPAATQPASARGQSAQRSTPAGT